MANAQKNTETKLIVTGITLNLSIREAMVLANLCGSVIGSHEDSYRKEANEIGEALHAQGITCNDIGAFEGRVEAAYPSERDLMIIEAFSGAVPLEKVDTPTIRYNIQNRNRIAAIKELRELVPGTGLKDAKEEIDRRAALLA
jgi:hypothetical protein